MLIPGFQLKVQLARPNCNWWAEFVRFSPFGCLMLSAGLEPIPPAAPQPTYQCAEAMCTVLWPQHKGPDMFLNMSEALELDKDAASRVSLACVWPASTDFASCWNSASGAGSKDLVQGDVCRLLLCRAKQSSTSEECVKDVCGEK